jgi:hypothetical protein
MEYAWNFDTRNLDSLCVCHDSSLNQKKLNNHIWFSPSICVVQNLSLGTQFRRWMCPGIQPKYRPLRS